MANEFPTYEHDFATSLDNDSKNRGVKKTTHAKIVLDVTEEDLHHIAIRQLVIKYQGRMRKHWEQHKNSESVTLKASELSVRMAGVRAVTKDSAKAFIDSMTPEERTAFLASLKE